MKIVIGITQDPEKIREFVLQYKGQAESVTEVGPFLSKEEAFAWRDCLKSRIGDIEEIHLEQETLKEAVLYGFTFEMII